MKKKRSFTLLELFIVLAIVGLISTLVGVGVQKKIRPYRFDRSIVLFTEQVSFCQKMASYHGLDITLNLFEEGKSIFISSQTEDGDAHIEAKLLRKEKLIDNVQMVFQGKAVNNIQFVFSSTHHMSPQGKLTFIDRAHLLEKREVEMNDSYFLRPKSS